jgi:hypothetical protein
MHTAPLPANDELIAWHMSGCFDECLSKFPLQSLHGRDLAATAGKRHGWKARNRRAPQPTVLKASNDKKN